MMNPLPISTVEVAEVKLAPGHLIRVRLYPIARFWRINFPNSPNSSLKKKYPYRISGAAIDSPLRLLSFGKDKLVAYMIDSNTGANNDGVWLINRLSP